MVRLRHVLVGVGTLAQPEVIAGVAWHLHRAMPMELVRVVCTLSSPLHPKIDWYFRNLSACTLVITMVYL